MTTTNHYAAALQQFRLRYFLPIVLAFNGNICEAARQCGVHRNTISRCLSAGGFSSERIRQIVRARRRREAA